MYTFHFVLNDVVLVNHPFTFIFPVEKKNDPLAMYAGDIMTVSTFSEYPNSLKFCLLYACVGCVYVCSGTFMIIESQYWTCTQKSIFLLINTQLNSCHLSPF